MGRQFGELIYYPFVEGLPEEPFVIPLIKEVSETKIFGEGWHSDTTYTEQPPKATALYSIEVPDTGGDTMFANMYQAYETLSPGMKELLGPLQAVNSASARKGGGRATGNAYQSVKLINRDQELEGIHPVVRTHPETGREALYVNALHTTHFVGWREAGANRYWISCTVIKRGPNSRVAINESARPHLPFGTTGQCSILP